LNNKTSIKIISPVDGDMLNERDGRAVDGSLFTKVKVSAPQGSKISINGISTLYEDGLYTAEVQLKCYSNVIKVVEDNSGSSESMIEIMLVNIDYLWMIIFGFFKILPKIPKATSRFLITHIWDFLSRYMIHTVQRFT